MAPGTRSTPGSYRGAGDLGQTERPSPCRLQDRGGPGVLASAVRAARCLWKTHEEINERKGRVHMDPHEALRAARAEPGDTGLPVWASPWPAPRPGLGRGAGPAKEGLPVDPGTRPGRSARREELAVYRRFQPVAPRQPEPTHSASCFLCGSRCALPAGTWGGGCATRCPPVCGGLGRLPHADEEVPRGPSPGCRPCPSLCPVHRQERPGTDWRPRRVLGPQSDFPSETEAATRCSEKVPALTPQAK